MGGVGCKWIYMYTRSSGIPTRHGGTCVAPLVGVDDVELASL